MIARLVSINALLVLSACANIAGDPSKMSAEQLTAAARDKKAVISCWNGKTMAGNVTMVYVDGSQANKLSSNITVKTDCETTLSTASQFEQAASVPAK